LKKWLARISVALIGAYVLLFLGVAWPMTRPPQQFGRIIRHLPMPLVWGVLPGPKMWAWAREGSLREGDSAPDFTLPTLDNAQRVTLSSHRGARPVVLVFGSYT
jgi:hypothetical protein